MVVRSLAEDGDYKIAAGRHGCLEFDLARRRWEFAFGVGQIFVRRAEFQAREAFRF